MITENKHPDNKRDHGGLENKAQHNLGMAQDTLGGDFDTQRPEEKLGTPVDNGGAKSTELESGLEEQWLAVRDEYHANYPDLERSDTEYEQGGFHTVIDRLATKTQRSKKIVQDEIKNWSSSVTD